MSTIHERLKSGSNLYWHAREWYTAASIRAKRLLDRPAKGKTRILFYNIIGLAYGGTEKFLQVLAKNLPKDSYEVHYMYSEQPLESSGIVDFSSRLNYLLEGKVIPIPFAYHGRESSVPYFVRGMSPDIFDVIKDYHIDLLVTSGAGHAEFPFSAIRNVPIIFINIFGQPNVQKNITYHVCISKEVGNKLSPVVPPEKVMVMPVPSEGPVEHSRSYGLALRTELGIPEDHIVFGRIGRAVDGIFDPIGIRAFQKVVQRYPNTHYLIISPPPALQKIITEEKIPNIHYAPPSGDEKKMWGFYEAMDVLAHFRRDGESFGMNIAEAMFCGKPIISHKSKFWNAHLEYLDPSFSFVADVDRVDQYVQFMEYFAQDTGKQKIRSMGEQARETAQRLFHIRHHIGTFEQLIKQSLKH